MVHPDKRSVGLAPNGCYNDKFSVWHPDERSVGLAPNGCAGRAPLERYLKATFLNIPGQDKHGLFAEEVHQQVRG